MWNRPGTGLRWLSGVVVLLSFCTTVGYLRHAWEMFPRWPDYRTRIEYKVPEWIAQNLPDARVATAGSVRIWYDSWRDLPQLGGGSDQAILSRAVEQSQWEIKLGPQPGTSILWMQCLGVDAVYVSDKDSQEPFKDTSFPHKYEGLLPVVFDDHQGNRIYRVPRRYPARVRVADTAHLDALRPPRSNGDAESLQMYTDVIEKGPDVAATLTRVGTDAIRIRVTLEAGQSVVVQESFDSAWHATSGGRRMPVRQDAMGFIAIDAPSGSQEIMLSFETPLENQLGRALTGISILAVLGLLAKSIREARRA
jgi:hypothetical protein